MGLHSMALVSLLGFAEGLKVSKNGSSVFLTMTNLNQSHEVLLFVCSKMADKTNRSF